MSYVDLSAHFTYKKLLTYQDMNQLGANDESMWHNIFRRELTTSADSIDITGLDGATQKTYLFVARLLTNTSYGTVKSIFEIDSNDSYEFGEFATNNWTSVQPYACNVMGYIFSGGSPAGSREGSIHYHYSAKHHPTGHPSPRQIANNIDTWRPDGATDINAISFYLRKAYTQVARLATGSYVGIWIPTI